MTRAFFEKIWNILLTPFGRLFPQLFALTLFYSLFRSIYLIESHNIIKAIICLVFWNSVISYTTCIISLLFKGKLNKLFWGIIITITLFYTVIESACVIEWRTALNEDTASVIRSTNPQESVEMAGQTLSSNYIFKTTILILAALCICEIVRRLMPINRKFQILFFFIFVLSLCYNIKNISIYSETPIYNIGLLLKKSDIPDLREHLQNPNIQYTRNNNPSKVVLIIGESHSRSHSSLYGYNKETNPRLSKLLSTSDTTIGKLIVFSNPKSPATQTVEAFKSILSTYNEKGKTDTVAWYDHTTIIEILKKARYKTHWISNQSKYGFFDNLVGKFSELCDTSLFVGSKYTSLRRYYLDDELIALKQSLENNDERTFDIFHLIGSHEDFWNRYPKGRTVFKESDYQNLPKNHREKIMHYDNSLVYNDSVISEIIKLYDNDDAVIIYSPDHALDLFESKPDYCAHAILGDRISSKYGTAIPFLIYLTNTFCEKRPDIVQSLENAKDKPYNTTNNIYTIMKLAGLKFADNDDVEKYALF